MKQVADAPVWYGAEQADAWANGYNSALEEVASPASTSPCLNCGDPSHEPFCGTCREMGCVGEKPSLSVKNDHALKSAAEKALNYIENTESELGIKLSCGDALREALK